MRRSKKFLGPFFLFSHQRIHREPYGHPSINIWMVQLFLGGGGGGGVPVLSKLIANFVIS